MELIDTWFGALGELTAPFWLTLQALAGLVATAGAGTAILGILLLFTSLDLLSSSKGPLVPVWRVAAIASSLFLFASVVFGDFMAGPAKAAYSAIVARAPEVPSSAVALSTLGAASAGLIFYVGRQAGARATATASKRPAVKALLSARREAGGFRVSEFGKTLALDPAGRLQLRQLSRNPKKAIHVVRPAVRYAAGRRIAHA
ncbi:MAG: hypothetical protein K8S25_02555 [Alphaproteobacteria bacterium]|nr:hypothetical protein [Alphaproteobacteria bacterium]